MSLEILGKISLDNLEKKPRRKNPEFYAVKIENEMKELAAAVNEKFGDVLDPDGRIKTTDQYDKKIIKIKEEVWARERGLNLEDFKEKQEKSNGSLAEKAITLSLAKVLGNKFLSVRSSVWDDYENGVDSLLVDTETGNLICGFDEVIEGYGQNGQDKKEEKIMQKFAKGGAYTKYGLELSSGENSDLKIATRRNLPTFFVAVNKEELNDLLENVSSEGISTVEKKVFFDLISSLEMQLDKMKNNDINVNEELKENLEKSEVLINILKEKIQG
jgi:hypothetical protein